MYIFSFPFLEDMTFVNIGLSANGLVNIYIYLMQVLFIDNSSPHSTIRNKNVEIVSNFFDSNLFECYVYHQNKGVSIGL